MENKLVPIDKLYWIFLTGFFIILALPLADLPPWLSPPDWGKTIIFRSVLAILLFLFFYRLVSPTKQNSSLISNPLPLKKSKVFWLFWLLVSLFFFSLIATLFSKDVRFSLWGSPYRSGGFINYGFYIIFALLVYLILRPKDWKKIWVFSFIIGGIVAFIAVLQQFELATGIFVPTVARPGSTIGGSIFLGNYLILIIFLLLVGFIKQPKILKKFLYFALLILYLFVIIISGARAVYLGMAFGVLFFVFFYPKKNIKIILAKVCLGLFLILAVFFVYYVNKYPTKVASYPLAKNLTISNLISRFSLNTFFIDPRFQTWKMVFPALKDRSLTGYGPENFSIAFDKHYQASIPYLSKEEGSWWDRAHNSFLEMGITNGLPALLVYLALFVVLIWHLQKLKKREDQTLLYHGLQATLIAYAVSIFFAFDTFSSYIIFFLIVAYALHLLSRYSPPLKEETQIKRTLRIGRGRDVILGSLLLCLILFLWFGNIKPFQINTQINIAKYFVEKKQCNPAFARLEKILPKHSILDIYLRLKYVDFVRICEAPNATTALTLAQKSIGLLQEDAKIRPTYTRFWIFLGAFTNVLIEKEKDPGKKAALAKEAYSYFEKAQKLSQNHQEIFIEWAKTDMVSGQYQKMKEKSQKCIDLNPDLADCYWMMGLAEIYLKNAETGQKNLQLAEEKNYIYYKINSIASLHQLTSAYASAEDYKNLVLTYQKLIALKPAEFRYHAALAFTYKALGEYKKAEQEAMATLGLAPDDPDVQQEVELFLQSLPKK